MKYAFQHDGKAFILKAEDGSTVRVGPRHEKYDYVQGVEPGRVIGISKSGRWTNAKDYDELYDKVSFGKAKQAARTEPKATKAKPTEKPTGKPKPKSSVETKRIQTLEAEVLSLKKQVQDLKQQYAAAQKAANARKSEPVRITKTKVPKKKKVVSEYRVSIQIKYFDSILESTQYTRDYFFFAELQSHIDKISEYERLTKGIVKSTLESKLNRQAKSIFFPGAWSGGFHSDVDTYRPVKVKVLSMTKYDFRELEVDL